MAAYQRSLSPNFDSYWGARIWGTDPDLSQGHGFWGTDPDFGRIWTGARICVTGARIRGTDWGHGLVGGTD